MTQTITDSAARPFGRAFIFPGRDSCAHAHGSLPFTCAPVSGSFFPPSPPQKSKSTIFGQECSSEGARGRIGPWRAFRDGRQPGEQPYQMNIGTEY